ncbi:MAG TPA: hypothetical protein VKY25_01380 [Erysipelothrix sp.]|nr:hypothetical protein [Erysipelothrix sp.]
MWGLLIPLVFYAIVTVVTLLIKYKPDHKKPGWQQHLKRLIEEFEMSLDDDDDFDEATIEPENYESIHYEYSPIEDDEAVDWDNYEAVFDSQTLPSIDIDTFDDVDEYEEIVVEREILEKPPVGHVQAVYFDAKKAREAFILSEIIQKPKSLRKQP